jgi:predicted alpha/beta superfamily hydrolase
MYIAGVVNNDLVEMLGIKCKKATLLIARIINEHIHCWQNIRVFVYIETGDRHSNQRVLRDETKLPSATASRDKRNVTPICI